MGFLNFLFEGKVDDLKNIYGDKFSPKQLEEIIETSNSLNVKHKYLIWLGKILKKTTNDNTFQEELSLAENLLTKFNSIGGNLPITDITKYTTLSDLSDAINTYENRVRRTIKKVDGADIIYEDDEYTIVHPKTYEASCFYGKGSKWCTASEDTTSHWLGKNKESKLFYFLSKKLPTSDRFYKVALLQYYEGKREFWDAPDNNFSSGWILGTEYLKKLLNIVDNYMNTNYHNQIEIFKDKEKAQIERDRLAAIERNQRINQRILDANNRRDIDEWNPEEINHGDVGAKAWALFTFLTKVEGVTGKDPNHYERLDFIESELDRLSNLQSQYEAEGRDLTDIDADISAYEEEREELGERIDVYDLIPEGSNYELTVFSIINVDYEGYEWTVGDESQIDSSAKESIKSLIGELGITNTFRAGFVNDFIDEDAVGELADELYTQWVYDEPESYLDETDDRLLSKSQEADIIKFQEKIKKYESFRLKAIKRQEDLDPESTQWKALERGIDKLYDLISDLEYDIESIKEEPDGDWDEDKITKKIEDLVDDAKNSPINFLNEMGIENIGSYIDEDAVIEQVIQDDGYYNTLNSYDGDGDTVIWDGEIYHIMNTDR
jgi:hypothetical protein